MARNGIDREHAEKTVFLSALLTKLIDKGILGTEDLASVLDYNPRQQKFVDELVGNIASGMSPNEAKMKAVHESYPRSRHRGEGYAKRLADENLERPEVCAYAEAKFVAAGLSTDGMFAKMVEHIKTATDAHPLGNYQALKDSIGLVLPKQPTKINQEIAIGVGVMSGPPGFNARQLPAPKRKLKKGDDDV